MENYLTEEQFQAACFLWENNEYFDKRTFTVDNNISHRLMVQDRVIEGARKKAVGCIPGVSDRCFVGMGFMCFIELKLHHGVQSDDQKIFMKMVEELGHMYEIIRPPLSNYQKLIRWLRTQ